MEKKSSKLSLYAAVLLLLSMLAGMVIPTQVVRAATITVCASGCDYSTIQDAINAASPGDTINVAAGAYGGQINVDKSVTIIGDPGDASAGPGPNAPVIDGGSAPGDAFLIANGVSDVTIQGFEMRNFTSPDLDGIGNGISAWVGSTSNITIQDNYFHDLGYNGVLVGNDWSSNPSKWGDHTNWLIKGNIIENFGYIGFELTNASSSSIEGNVIHMATPYISAIFSSARRSESGLTVKNNQIDGAPSALFPVIYIYAYDLDMPNPNLDGVLIEGNTIATVGTPFQIYIRNIGSGTVTNVQVHNNSLMSLRNLTAAMIDASANWWGDLNPSDNITSTGSVDYTPWLNVGTDMSGDPGFQGDFSYLNVDDDSPQTGSVGRIQEGVDLVTASTVHVAAGTYVEQVVITASMTVFGDGAASTFIVAPSTIPVASDPDSTIVKIAGSGVSVDISGFTVTGPGPGGCGTINTGIFVRDDAYANIHDNRILDIRDNPFSGCQNGVAIQVGRASLGTNGAADISNNEIAGYQKNGVTVSNAGSSATLTNNTITGAGATTIIAQNGVQFSGGATGSVNGNTISNHSYSPGDWTSTGMLLWGADVNTSDNIMSENQTGIYHIEGSGVHDANILNVSTAGTLSPYLYGFVVDAPPPGLTPSPFEDGGAASAALSTFSLSTASVQDVDVVNNELTGDGTSASYGIGAYGGFGVMDIDLTVKNNKVHNFGTGLDIYQCTGGGCTTGLFSSVAVNLNSITGNADYGLLNTDAIPVNAELNWWGSPDGPAPTGSGDLVSGDADYTPWLCDGTDTSTATGFQHTGQTDCAPPIVSDMIAQPSVVYLNGWILIKATADDSTTGNANIASAEYNLNNSGWLPMTALDGAFDEVTEVVKVKIKASTAGANQVCVRAADIWGNVSEPVCVGFTAKYKFSGFFNPVDMSSVVNVAKAGKIVPVIWKLTDVNGKPVSDPASFVGLVFDPVDCSTFSLNPIDLIEFYKPLSGLKYLGGGKWSYNWQIPVSSANTCGTMYIQFKDGTTSPVVNFKFVN